MCSNFVYKGKEISARNDGIIFCWIPNWITNKQIEIIVIPEIKNDIKTDLLLRFLIYIRGGNLTLLSTRKVHMKFAQSRFPEFKTRSSARVLNVHCILRSPEGFGRCTIWGFPCGEDGNLFNFGPAGGDSAFLRNVGTYRRVYSAPNPELQDHQRGAVCNRQSEYVWTLNITRSFW